jgi:hypothetical protein
MDDRLSLLDGLRSLFLDQGEIASPMPVGRGTKDTDIMMVFKIRDGQRWVFLSPGGRISS